MSRYTITITPDDFNRGYVMHVVDEKLRKFIVPAAGGHRPVEPGAKDTVFMKGSDGGEVEQFALALMVAVEEYKMAQNSNVYSDKHRLTQEFGEAFKEARGSQNDKPSASKALDEGKQR